MSDSLWPHESQQASAPCSSPSPGVHSDSRPLSPWCHPAISSSVVPFSSCPQSLPASESVPMSQLFTWGGQSIGVSASASFLPKNTQDWSPLEWTSGFPYFLQFQSEFGNKEFMIWAPVSSRSCFCWLYRASPSLAANNIINLISVLTIKRS